MSIQVDDYPAAVPSLVDKRLGLQAIAHALEQATPLNELMDAALQDEHCFEFCDDCLEPCPKSRSARFERAVLELVAREDL